MSGAAPSLPRRKLSRVVQCSAVAAGGMQRSNGVVDRQAWLAVAKSMLLAPKTESFFHLQMGALCTDPHFLRWIASFTRSSLFGPTAIAKERQEHMLRFTCWAIEHTKDVIKQLGVERDIGFSSSGALKLCFQDGSPGKKHNSNEPTKVLTPEEALEIEPCISNLPRKLHSGTFLRMLGLELPAPQFIHSFIHCAKLDQPNTSRQQSTRTRRQERTRCCSRRRW